MPDTPVAARADLQARVLSDRQNPWERWRRGIHADAAIFALILLGCAFFYLHWDFWEDQSAQVYMTWGMFHGMRPYVDLVDPNWPGILLPHTLAYLMAGTHPWGLRTLDLLFGYGLLLGTSIVLEAWGTPMGMRLLCGCAYLTNYLATGWMWTAQRESFCWPLFVISVIPFLIMLAPRRQSSPARQSTTSAQAWFWFGAIAGFSLWIKPSPWPAVAGVYLVAVALCNREDRGRLLRGVFWHILGIAAVSICFVATLAALGELSGFIKWGIFYDLGPYSQIKFTWPARLQWSVDFLADPAMRPVALLLAILVSPIAFFWPRRLRYWTHPARPVMVSLMLVTTSALAVLMQGKPSSLYHFIPLEWSLALYAAVVVSIIWRSWMRELAWIAVVIVVGITLFGGSGRTGPTVGAIAGERLRSSLGPSDQVVEWGYAPSLLLHAEHRTPFMTFIGTAFMVTSPDDSWAAREVLDRLNRALQNPAVRYLLVERLPNFRMRADILNWPKDYLYTNPSLRQTLLARYDLLPDNTLPGFDVYAQKAALRSR